MSVEIGNDPKFAKFAETLKRLGEKAAYIGVLASGKGNEPHSGSGDEPVTQLQVATWMEFGTSDDEGDEIVPERSFLRETLRLTKPEVEAFVTKRVRDCLTGKIAPDAVHEATGIKVVGLCQEHIAQGINPPLKYREGTPLIDTGQLRSSITYEVR